jgi:P-type Cu+ transporter
MAACCAISALVIYHLMNIHSRLSKAREQAPETTQKYYSRNLPSSLAKVLSPDLDDADSEGTCCVHIKGMTCQSCVAALETAVKKITGVLSVSVSLQSLCTRIRYNPEQVGPDNLLNAIEDVGFSASMIDQDEDWKVQWLLAARTRRSEVAASMRMFRLSIAASGFLFLMQSARTWTTALVHSTETSLTLFELVVATLSVTFLAGPIHREAYRAIRSKEISSSLLSSAGLLAVYAASLLSSYAKVVLGTNGDIEGYSLTSACMLLTVILGGRVTKGLVTEQSTELPTALATVVPDIALVVSSKEAGSNTTEVVPTRLLQPGDEVVIDANTTFPADCVVLHGTTTVLETITKGEIVPRAIGKGELINAGTTNCDTKIVASVVRCGKDTWLGQTLQAFEQVNNSRLSSSLASDRSIGMLSTAVLVYATLVTTFYLLRGFPTEEVLTRLATILLCACPCSLSLGIPICLMASSCRYHLTLGPRDANRHVVNAYNKQILLRPSERVVRAAESQCTVLDKTGTLTEGALRICSEDFAVNSSEQHELLWRMIREMTRDSPHPVSALLQQMSKDRLSTKHETNEPLVMESKETQPGLGQCATFSLQAEPIRLTIGNKRMMQQNNVYIDSRTDVEVAVPSPITSSAYIAVNDMLAGTVKFSDKILPGATSFVHSLHQSGVAIYMMTGDNKPAALSVGEEVGISSDRVFAPLLPHEKAARIAELERLHGPVIMVGDNLNDAAALASASLGIVVSHDSNGRARSSQGQVASLLPVLHAEADVYTLPFREQHDKSGIQDETLHAHDDFDRINYVLDLIKTTKQRIDRVTKWSTLYNVISLALASGIIKLTMPGIAAIWLDLSPTTASLAMSLSSLCTLQYALKLSTWRPIQQGGNG